MAKEKKEEKTEEKTEILLPKNDCSQHYYITTTFAFNELYKWTQEIFRGEKWPHVGIWPKYYLTGMNTIGYPDLASYTDDEQSPHGYGLYCYVMTTEPADIIGVLTHGQKDKEHDVNCCVHLLELLNPNDVFKDEHIKTLCSDWAPDNVVARTVSTNGSTFIFHPRVSGIQDMVESVKRNIDNLSNFDEFTKNINRINSQLERLTKKTKQQKKSDKELEHKLAKARELVQSQNYGIFWSDSKPEMMLGVIENFIEVIEDVDPNADFDALNSLKNLLPEIVCEKKKNAKRAESMIKISDIIAERYDALITSSSKGELYRYKPVKNLSYNRASVSALQLSTRGYRNNIQENDQPIFKIHHIFLFNKNFDALPSVMPAKQFHSSIKSHMFKGKFYDGFQLVF